MRTLSLTPAPKTADCLVPKRWLFVSAAALALTFIVSPLAEAQGRSAKLSRDVQARLAAPGGGRTDVIVDNLSRDAVERLSAKHGARVKRHFSRGAVLDVDAAALAALAADGEVPHISGNHTVISTM